MSSRLLCCAAGTRDRPPYTPLRPRRRLRLWDVEAAKNADLPCLCLRSGGFGADELQRAGAVAVLEGPADVLDQVELRERGR